MKALPKIEVSTPPGPIIVYPNRLEHGSERKTTDTILSGECTLSLPELRQISDLQIYLIGTQRLKATRSSESYIVLHTSFRFDTGREALRPGAHRFEFSFAIPAEQAPSEETPHGSTQYVLRAIAAGIGRWGMDVCSEQTVRIVSSPSPSGGLPLGLDSHVKSTHDGFGEIQLSLSTPHLLLTSELQFSITIPRVLLSVSLLSIEVSLRQTSDVKHMRKKEKSASYSSTWSIWKLPFEPCRLKTLELGSGFALEETLSIPRDGAIRCSTPESARTGIQVSHQIKFHLQYLSPPGKDKTRSFGQLRYKIPVTISSACCVGEDLPTYASALQDPVDLANKGFCRPCLGRLIHENAEQALQRNLTKEDITARLGKIGITAENIELGTHAMSRLGCEQ